MHIFKAMVIFMVLLSNNWAVAQQSYRPLPASLQAKTYFVLINAVPQPRVPHKRPVSSFRPDDMNEDGGAESEQPINYNRQEFYEDIKHAYQVLSAQGQHPIVLAADGRWSLDSGETPTDVPITGSFRSVDDLTSALNQLHLKAQDQVLIYFSGHGDSPWGPIKNDTDLLNGQIEAWDQSFPVADLKKALEQYPDVSWKLSGNLCHIGSLQAIARQSDNICVATPVAYFQTFQPGEGAIESQYDVGFWSAFKGSQNISLAEAATSGFAHDMANPVQGRLSSFDLVDLVLHKGAYEKDRQDYDADSEKRDLPKDYHLATDADSELQARSFFKFQSSSSENLTQKVLKTKAAIEHLEVIFKKLFSLSFQQESNSNIFQTALSDLSANIVKYQKAAERYDSLLAQARGNAKEIKRLQALADHDLASFRRDQSLLHRLAELEHFADIATTQQREQFRRLLLCEWQPLALKGQVP